MKKKLNQQSKKKKKSLASNPPPAPAASTESAPATPPARQRPQSLSVPTHSPPLVCLGLVATIGTAIAFGRVTAPSDRRPPSPRSPQVIVLQPSPPPTPRPPLPSPAPSSPPPAPTANLARRPAVPPAQSRVLQRLAQWQSRAFAPAATMTAGSAMVPLALRDAIALALADDPAAKQAYLERLSQHQSPPSARLALSSQVAILPSADASAITEWYAAMQPPALSRPSLTSAQLLPARTHLDRQYQQISQDLARRAQVTERVTAAIFTYRRLLLAQETERASQRSLVDAERHLARQYSLVAAGRQARGTLPALQRAAANAERRLLAAQRHLESERLYFLADLEITADRDFFASENLARAIAVPVAANLDAAELWQLAQQQQPDYLRSQLAASVARLAARTRAAAEPSGPSDRAATATTDDIPQRRGRDRQARPTRQPIQQHAQQARQDWYAAVRAAIQTVQAQFSHLEQAQQGLAAAEAELTTREAQQAAGRPNPLALQQAQRRLAVQRQAVVQAQIDYLNAIAALDRATGTTLLRWQIVTHPPRQY